MLGQYFGISSNKFWSCSKFEYCGDYLGKGIVHQSQKQVQPLFMLFKCHAPRPDTHFGCFSFAGSHWCGVFRSSDVTHIGTISIRHGPLMLSHQTFQKFSHKQPTGVHTQRKYTFKLLYRIFNTLGLYNDHQLVSIKYLYDILI